MGLALLVGAIHLEEMALCMPVQLRAGVFAGDLGLLATIALAFGQLANLGVRVGVLAEAMFLLLK